MAYSSEFMKDWNFENSKQTKELRLTHTLIAGEAHFEELYNIYDSDPVLKLKKDLKAYVKKKQIEIEEDKTFDEVLNEIEWFYQKGKNTGKSHLEVFLDDPSNEKLYSHVKDLPYSVVSKFYWEKDQLIDDKIEKDGKIIRDAKRDALIAHLFRIQDIIALYISSNYRDLLRKIGRKIQRNSDKRELHDELESLRLISQKSIGEVIDFANEKSLCVKSDAFNSFIEKNEYLYWRVSAVPYSVFQNLYSYIEGRRPFSTQHKVKGLEYENVLVILDSSGWNKYNFDYVLDDSIYDSLPKGKKESYKRIKRRTESIFATNLGGEIVRWSIENIDKNLHKKEPYKRLWILGKPCIIKFKCKLSQMRERSRTDVIVEILKYFIVTKMYKYPYEFDFTGMTIGSVPSENILSIEEIENFIEIHEKYEVGFYDELKNNK